MHEKIDLPAFEYSDPDTPEAVIYSYMIKEYGEMTGADEHDITIPYFVILDKDESDPEDIRVLLDGWVMSYNLEDRVLEMQSGAGVSGAAHIRKTAAGYEVTSFENVTDGEDYDKSAREIFGDHYEDFINLDEAKKEEVRKQILKDYVTKNGLDVTAYKDFDTEPVEL